MVSYAPSFVPATKDKRCLPAGGVGWLIRENYDKINSGLLKAGEELLQGMDEDHWNRSSSENDSDYAWAFNAAPDGGFNPHSKDYGAINTNYGVLYVRPVLAF